MSTELRAMTLRSRIFARLVTTASCIPSAKSLSFSKLGLANGSTAMDLPGAVAGADFSATGGGGVSRFRVARNVVPTPIAMAAKAPINAAAGSRRGAPDGGAEDATGAERIGIGGAVTPATGAA